MKRSLEVWLPMLLLAAAAPAAAQDAKTLFERGFHRRAAAACEQRLAANPRDAEAGAILSRITSNRGDVNRALELAQAAAAADPKNADAQYALSEIYGRKAQRSSVLNQPGLAGKMRKAADACLAIDPNHVDALEILVDFHRFAPGFMGGDKKKAAEFSDRIVRVEPVAGWIKKAETAQDSKDSTEAGECYRKAAAVSPDPGASSSGAHGRALVAYASWLTPRWRDPAAAEKLALAAVQAEPWRTGGWSVLAGLYARESRWSDLELVLKQSETAEPSHLAPWYHAARQLVVEGREPARAEGYLRHYLSREPEIGAPSAAFARWRLGLALEAQGKRNEAVAEMNAALKLDPKLEDAKKDLKRLRG